MNLAEFAMLAELSVTSSVRVCVAAAELFCALAARAYPRTAAQMSTSRLTPRNEIQGIPPPTKVSAVIGAAMSQTMRYPKLGETVPHPNQRPREQSPWSEPREQFLWLKMRMMV